MSAAATDAAGARGAPPGAWHRAVDDIDRQGELLPDWPQEYLQLERGRLSSWARGTALGERTLVFEKHTDRRLHKRFSTPDGWLGLALPGPQSAPIAFDGRPAGPGSVLVLPPGRDFDIVCHGRFDVRVALFEAGRLGAWLAGGARVEAAVIAAGPRPHALGAAIDAALGPPRDAPAGAAAPAAPALAWRLEGAAIDVLGGAPVADRTAERHRRSLLDAARRQLLDDDAHDADGAGPSLERVADQLDVSVRWLHQAFRAHLGLAPQRYARLARLARARAALRRRGGSADDADATAGVVADVALRCGFAHLGRFAGHYRSAFGELPSQTLRAARPARALRH